MLRFGIPSALTSLPQTVNLRFDQMLIIAFPAGSLARLLRRRRSLERRCRAVADSRSDQSCSHMYPPRPTPSAGATWWRQQLQGGTLVATLTSVALHGGWHPSAFATRSFGAPLSRRLFPLPSC